MSTETFFLLAFAFVNSLLIICWIVSVVVSYYIRITVSNAVFADPVQRHTAFGKFFVIAANGESDSNRHACHAMMYYDIDRDTLYAGYLPSADEAHMCRFKTNQLSSKNLLLRKKHTEFMEIYKMMQL